MAALDLGFLPGAGGRDVAGIVDGAQKGEIDFIYLLGADEFDVAHLGRAFVVYQGSHGDAGAHHADVVLPGAAYTEKEGLYVNFEGRVQRGRTRRLPAGRGQGRLGHPARSVRACWACKLPYDDRAALRAAMAKDAPHFARLGEAPVHADTSAATWNGIGDAGPAGRADAGHARASPITISPTRSRGPARPWPSAARNSCTAQPRWRRNKMALIHFWTWLFEKMGVALPYGWAWFLSQAVFIVLICLVLMLSVAAVILADRKIWAAVQMRRGPNVVGPFGLLQTIADALKFFFKEVIIPAGANKVLFLLAPAGQRGAGLHRLGGDPLQHRLGDCPTSMSASFICSRCRRSASMA